MMWNWSGSQAGTLVGFNGTTVNDGGIFIGGFVPDFISIKGEKRIVELFSDYWHRNTEKKDRERIKAYKKNGYRTLIIWEHELKDEDKILNKMLQFKTKKIFCEYFPCHDNVELKNFSCEYCFCPIFPCKDLKLGKWVKSINGNKYWDCSNCNLFHDAQVVKALQMFVKYNKNKKKWRW